MSSTYDYVSINAIPYNALTRASERLGPTRKALAAAIDEANRHFQTTNGEVVFLHKQTVVTCQKALDDLEAAIAEYRRNLGWS